MSPVLHDRFDITRWAGIFLLDDLANFLPGATMSGPGEVAIVEQLKRRALGLRGTLGAQESIDLCVWSWGEGPNREMTRVGGTPYRPVKALWPRDEDGTPLTFVGQFNFRDSRDLGIVTPADILLIFSRAHFSSLRFEWHDVTDQPLVDSDGVPPAEWAIQPCFATLLRTHEYPDASFDDFPAKFPLSMWAHGGTGSKIGGFGAFYDYTIHLDEELQSNEEPGEEHCWALRMIEWQKARGPLICRLESICPGPRWPFINRSELGSRWYSDVNLLSIGDAGAIDIYLSDTGDVSHTVSSG